ncbi:keratin-associated protein 6-2 [Pan paniscus]|nr:keratin-associated protein 6-2 [Pan paniscus]
MLPLLDHSHPEAYKRPSTGSIHTEVTYTPSYPRTTSTTITMCGSYYGNYYGDHGYGCCGYEGLGYGYGSLGCGYGSCCGYGYGYGSRFFCGCGYGCGSGYYY